MLAEALCKLEGFTYAPSDTDSTGSRAIPPRRDFLYVTTQTLSAEQLAQLSEEVGPIAVRCSSCATAFRGNADHWPNLTVQEDSRSTFCARCEWGHDDYSLNVANLPRPS